MWAFAKVSLNCTMAVESCPRGNFERASASFCNLAPSSCAVEAAWPVTATILLSPKLTASKKVRYSRLRLCTFGDDNKLTSISSVRKMCSTTELNRVVLPVFICWVFDQLFNLYSHTHHTYRIRVSLIFEQSLHRSHTSVKIARLP